MLDAQRSTQVAEPVATDWRCPGYSPSRLDYLAVVLKVAERCNIDCTYCHVFSGSDDSWIQHPKFMRRPVFERTAEFLQRGAQALPNLRKVRVVLQGGEPMLMRAQEMATGLETLRRALTGVTELELVMQTNGMLVCPDWISLIEEYDIAVGVSLDGPASVHDKRRIDHAGKGTYSRVVRGLKALQSAARAGRIREPTALAVIDVDAEPRAVYQHLVHDLQVRTINFLLPKNSYEQLGQMNPDAYGPWLCSALEAWLEEDDPSIDVRIFRGLLWTFLRDQAFPQQGDNLRREWESVICVASNGALGPDDEYRAISTLWNHFQPFNVNSTSLPDFLDSPPFHLLNRAKRDVCNECVTCLWRPVCGAGALVNRYDKVNEFNNVSFLCGSLKQLYSRVVDYLTRSGVPWQQIAQALTHA